MNSDDNPRPDLFNDRRTEGRRAAPTAAESYLTHGVNEESKMRRAATQASAMKARVKARSTGNA